MRGRWRIKHPRIRPLAVRAGELLAAFPVREIRHIPREENGLADALSNRAIDEAGPGALTGGSQGEGEGPLRA
jgi:hypothetical protein